MLAGALIPGTIPSSALPSEPAGRATVRVAIPKQMKFSGEGQWHSGAKCPVMHAFCTD